MVEATIYSSFDILNREKEMAKLGEEVFILAADTANELNKYQKGDREL